MKTPNLLEVPKTHPSRKEKLEAFKVKHGIFTHDAGPSSEDCRWLAMLVPKSREYLKDYDLKPDAHPIELIASYCRLLEEAGLLVTGPSEGETVRYIRKINNIEP